MPLNVFTIPAGHAFVDALAAGLLARAGADAGPEVLARMTVLLPTRRACRALREAFLRRGGGRPLLLPRMRPIGDVDEEELVLTAGEDGAAGTLLGDLAPAIGTLERRLILARLIGRRGDPRVSPDQAVWLAADLARLLDEAATERRDFAGLAALVPAEFAQHWQKTIDFLEIVTAAWPHILAQRGAVDAAAHRNRMLAVQAEAWRTRPPADPVIAAGSTGSIPATADLLKVIAGLPHGAVVLPGLDHALEQAAWDALDTAPTHPQHGLARLLAHIGVARAEVAVWDGADERLPPFLDARRAVLSAALRPADATARRPGDGLAADPVARAFSGDVAYLECANPREEAAAIAAALREMLDDPLATAALVTPDRDLARRVAAAVRRWGIDIDNSAGIPLAATPPGAFLRLLVDAAAEDFAPVPLLALLKHPLAAGGETPAAFRTRVRRLERLTLRGPRPAPGFAGLRDRAAREQHADALLPWLDGLAERLQPLIAALRGRAAPPAALLRAHIAAAEALAADDAGAGARRLWAGADGEAMARYADALAAALAGHEPVAPADYPALFDALIAGPVVRPRYGTHPRLAILGPLEARLQRFDLMILGGLNEGIWPAALGADPWMSRPMRAEFGLPPHDRRIGQSAHDFVQAAMAPRVILTRALRQAGQPTRPSRWLLRIEAELAGLGVIGPRSAHKTVAWRAQNYQAIMRALDATPHAPCARPTPCPPVAARPRTLSVTQIELWRRDPYALYAQQILKLRPLDDIDTDPTLADLGSAIHHALAEFVRAHRDRALPAGALALVLAEGERALEEFSDRPDVWAFWRPRFARIARWFVGEEAARRAGGTLPLACEVTGTLTLPGPAGAFTLKGKADRIDRLADGSLAVLDYKTGAVPGNDEIALGYAVQLPLLGLLAQAGAFPAVAGAVGAFEYWRLAGRDGGEIKTVKMGPPALIADAGDGLATLIARYDDPAQHYPAMPRPARALRFNDYAQLARIGEWSGGGEP